MKPEEFEEKVKEEIRGLKSRIEKLEKERPPTTVIHNHYHTLPSTTPTPAGLDYCGCINTPTDSSGTCNFCRKRKVSIRSY